MEIIKHRQNSMLDKSANQLITGVEIDVRTYKGDLILNHDPFKDGVKLKEWINQFNLKLLIVNVKEEGLEDHLIKIFRSSNITNYFILDETIPYILKYCNAGFSKFALRVSLWEDLSSAVKIVESMNHKPSWIWLDTFNGKISIDYTDIRKLKSLNLKICLVSPELHPEYDHKVPTDTFVKQFQNLGEENFDAVCTKQEIFWFHLISSK